MGVTAPGLAWHSQALFVNTKALRLALRVLTQEQVIPKEGVVLLERRGQSWPRLGCQVSLLDCSMGGQRTNTKSLCEQLRDSEVQHKQLPR